MQVRRATLQRFGLALGVAALVIGHFEPWPLASAEATFALGMGLVGVPVVVHLGEIFGIVRDPD